MIPINSSVKTLLASQPIYTRDQDLFGFELLFRHETNLSASEFGDDLATSEVLLNLCTGITEQFDLYSRPLFINLAESFLFSEAFLPIPAQGVVLELSPSIQVNDRLIDAIRNWKSLGFHFALDDFNFDPRYRPLLNLVDFLKVNVLDKPPEKVAEKMADFAAYALTWVAERVETEEQFLKYCDLNFTLFQGYFLAKPLHVQGYAIRGKIHNSVAIINEVNKPELEIDELVSAVGKDPNLATQILKIINSPACYLKRNITSLKDAITFLGLVKVRKWAIMMAMLNDAATSSGTVRLVLTRARACENYAATTIFANPDKAFLMGLLSGIHLLFGIENAVFLEQVSLHADIETAILTHGGILGQILNEILHAEYTIMQNPKALTDNNSVILFSYLQASDWAEQALSSRL